MITNKQGTNYFYQWDTNQYVVLNEKLATCTHVHFKNPNSSTAYKVKVVGGEARIPDELFQVPEIITAWVYDETETRTVSTKEFYVYEKQKPVDYEFTPTDAEVYRTLNERVANMEKVIDIVSTLSPLPVTPEERKPYKLLAVRENGEGQDPTGCNISLDDLLKAEVTQQELDDAIAAQGLIDKAQNEKIAAQDALIKGKVDSTAYSSDKTALEGEIAKKADSSDLTLKADKADTYTKNEVDTLIREGVLSGEIYGVDFNMVTGAAKRLDSAVGLEFHRFIGGAGSTPVPTAKSFMNVGPWANIYQTLRTVEGNNLVARTGDANFETALRSGECNLFTCIPMYYIKMETPVVDGQAHWVLHVSAKPFAGAFSVIEDDAIEIASLVTASKGGKHVSQPDTVPLVATHIYSFEAQAETQGLYNSSWKDFLSWWILMLVQTASLNSQNTVAAGVSSGFPFSWGDANWSKIMEASNGATNSIVVRKQSFKKSMLIYIGTNYNNGSLGKRHVTDVQPHGTNPDWLIVSFDGEPITTTTDHWCTACAQDTSIEAVLAMGLDCGYYKPNAEFSEGNCHSFVYGICDPWGNIFQCPSGIAKQNQIVYVSSDREACPKAFPAAGWNQVEEFPFIGSDYPSEWRIKQTSNNITLIPTKMGGNSNMNFGDRTWDANDGAVRLPWRGGSWGDGTDAGACSFSWHTADGRSIYYGGRLAYRKRK